MGSFGENHVWKCVTNVTRPRSFPAVDDQSRYHGNTTTADIKCEDGSLFGSLTEISLEFIREDLRWNYIYFKACLCALCDTDKRWNALLILLAIIFRFFNHHCRRASFVRIRTSYWCHKTDVYICFLYDDSIIIFWNVKGFTCVINNTDFQICTKLLNEQRNDP